MSSPTIDQIADRLFAAMEAGDVEAIAAMWARDVAVWHCAAGESTGRTGALAMIQWMVANSLDRRYQVIARHEFDGGFVQQHLLRSTALDGTTVTVRVAIIVLVGADGLITRMDEYFDPAALAALLSR